MPLKSILLLGLTLIPFRAGWAGQEPEVSLGFVQTAHASSFPPLMRVAVRNPAYTPLNLLDRMVASELLIDGKPSPKKEPSFRGPPGLPAKGQWEACLPIEDYVSLVPSGKHHVVFRMGGARSNEAAVDWRPAVNWRKGNMKTRMKEVRDMTDALTEGLARSCVEEWLTVKDGGEQESGPVRYFLEPQIKVIVTYTHEGGAGRDEEVVKGPVQVYEEPRLRD
jgi:hypothetical protein